MHYACHSVFSLDMAELQAASQQAQAGGPQQTDAVPLGQTGASGSLHSESGDTALDRLRGSGTSCDPSSEERRRDEASRGSLSEQNEAGSDPKVFCLLCHITSCHEPHELTRHGISCCIAMLSHLQVHCAISDITLPLQPSTLLAMCY